MKKRMTNEVHIEGWVFDHKLEVKVTGDTSKNPGTEYIAGVLNVATDEKCMNVVPVHYTYVTATTASGKTNNTYNVLKSIIDGAPTVSSVGREGATKVRIDTAIGLNEWYQDEKTLVSVKRNEGGFIHILVNEDVDGDETRRSAFKTDMLIQSIFEQDADEERGLPSKVVVKGYIFNFRNQLLPVEFVAIRMRRSISFVWSALLIVHSALGCVVRLFLRPSLLSMLKSLHSVRTRFVSVRVPIVSM